MKLVIAGSRYVTDRRIVLQCVLESGWMEEITEVGHGAAPGVDSVAAWMFKPLCPVTPFPADWNRYGKRAGPIRNGEMARWGDRLVAIALPNSKGTADMIRKMRALGKPVAHFELIDDEIKRMDS